MIKAAAEAAICLQKELEFEDRDNLYKLRESPVLLRPLAGRVVLKQVV
jgi:hypothetical protein